jgi:hypothetical protein
VTSDLPPDLNIPYDGSPALRRGPLPLGCPGARAVGSSLLFDSAGQDARSVFGGMSQGDSIMQELIQTSSQASFTQEESQVYAEQEQEEWDDDDWPGKEQPTPVSAPEPARKNKVPKKAGTGSRGPKWRSYWGSQQKTKKFLQ